MRDLQATRVDMQTMRADIAATLRDHQATIDAFHKLWYAQPFTWPFTFYEGLSILKNPLDLWVYQEIIRELKPTLILETGTAYGASALYFAHQLDRVGQGGVISIDVEPANKLPQHPRIQFLRGSSTDPEIVRYVHAQATSTPQRVMVILDSDHAKAHVAAELEAYAPLVSVDQFLVVEDTNLNGRPLDLQWKGGEGPGPAVDEFLAAHPAFVRDRLAERYLLTMFPGGWLKRMR